MPEEGNDAFFKPRLAFVNFLVDSDPEETWRLFCQAIPEITSEQVADWRQSSQKNKVKETINNELPVAPATVSDTGNSSNQNSQIMKTIGEDMLKVIADQVDIKTKDTVNDSNQNSLTLTTIANDMLKEIADRVDIKTKRALRLTCKKVLDLINEHWKLKDVHIHLDHHKVKFPTPENKNLEFYDRKRKLEDGDQESNLSQKSFLQETADKFEQIIQDPKTQLGKFFITGTKENEMARKQEKLLHLIFEKIKKPIHVESLKIDLPCTNSLESVLKKVKVGSLTELDLFYFSTNGSEDSALMNIIENPHWMHFKTFHVLGCASNVPMIAYKDVPSLLVSIKNVTLDEIKEYKKALLMGRGDLRQEFLGWFDVEEIAEALKPYEKLGEINETKGTFLRKDGTKLKFELNKISLSFSCYRL